MTVFGIADNILISAFDEHSKDHDEMERYYTYADSQI